MKSYIATIGLLGVLNSCNIVKSYDSKCVLNVTKDEIGKYDGPEVVLKSAEWCGPCREFKPIYEEIACEQKFNGRAQFEKYDVTNSSSNEINKRYGFSRFIPDVVVLKDDKKLCDIDLKGFDKKKISKSIDDCLKKHNY